MLGWWILITDRPPRPPDDAEHTAPGPGDEPLASWEVGVTGLGWITGLLADGRAEQLSFNGYPNRYAVRAGDLLPLLADGLPPGHGPYGVPHRARVFPERIAALPADRLLTVDAWDQS